MVVESIQTNMAYFIVVILCVRILYHVDSAALRSNTLIPRFLRTLYYFRIPSVAVHDFSTPLYRHAVDHQRRFKYHQCDVDCNWRCHHQQNYSALTTKKIIYVEYILYYFLLFYYFTILLLFFSLFLLEEVHNALILLTRIVNFNQIIIE